MTDSFAKYISENGLGYGNGPGDAFKCDFGECAMTLICTKNGIQVDCIAHQFQQELARHTTQYLKDTLIAEIEQRINGSGTTLEYDDFGHFLLLKAEIMSAEGGRAIWQEKLEEFLKLLEAVRLILKMNLEKQISVSDFNAGKRSA